MRWLVGAVLSVGLARAAQPIVPALPPPVPVAPLGGPLPAPLQGGGFPPLPAPFPGAFGQGPLPLAPLPRGPFPGGPVPAFRGRFSLPQGPLFPAGRGFPHHPLSGRPILRPFVPLRCPPIPLRPSDNEHCKWTGLHDVRGCLIRYKCEPLEPPPKPCPSAPRRPDRGRSCNWIPIQDKRNCIVDYECEPLTPPPCPAPPERPGASPVCRWIAIKDKKNCVTSYSCEPTVFIPRLFPRPRVLRRRVPLVPRVLPFGAPLASPAHPLGPLSRFRSLLSGPRGDAHPLCCFWAAVGQCPLNPAYMLNDCRHACKSPICIRGAGLKKHK